MRDFDQHDWNRHIASDLRELMSLAVREDGGGADDDLTSCLLVPRNVLGDAHIVARTSGVFAGVYCVDAACDVIDAAIKWLPDVNDGETFGPDISLGFLTGRVRSLLTAERLVLNLLGRLCGIATLTAQYVAAAQAASPAPDRPVRVYDTRKTTLGWRRLEKYAVRCGGGHNHRMGLRDAVLIKDNHIAFGATAQHFTLPEAVERVREQLTRRHDKTREPIPIVEIEVDDLDQLRLVLPASPDIVLLDNMTPSQLRDAVAMRNALAPAVELEASGGVTLDTIGAIAATGVERISVGAITHSATTLDIGLDWHVET